MKIASNLFLALSSLKEKPIILIYVFSSFMEIATKVPLTSSKFRNTAIKVILTLSSFRDIATKVCSYHLAV